MSYSSTKSFKIFLTFGILLLWHGSHATDGNLPVRITQQQFQVPVLTNKPDNPVLRIKISVEDDDPLVLTGMRLGTAGTTDLHDLKAVRIYYQGKDSLTGDFSGGKADLFGAAGRPGRTVQVSGRLELGEGDHFFWVTLELEPQAALDHRISVLCSEVSLNGVPAAAAPVPEPLKQRIGVAVRRHGQDGVHTSRIPGLATTNRGTLLAIFDARYESARDLQGDIDIGLHRSTDGGKSWEPIRIVLDKKEWGDLPEKFNGVSDACILVDRNSDAIYIAGLWMHGVISPEGTWIEGLDENSVAWNHQWRNKGSQPGYGVKQTSQFLIVKSTDDGKTWSEPVNLTRMCKKEAWWLLAPAPGRGITLDDGTLVFPTEGRDETGRSFSNITYSKDGGETWITSNPAYEGTTECAVVQLSDGSLMLNMRSGKNKGNTGNDNGRAVAVTRDLGKTWKEHPSSFRALPEPTCMASLHKHVFEQDGAGRSILVFSNPDSKQYRENMTLKVSLDDGNTWPEQNQVLLDEGRGRGYSCITSVDEEHVGILYESSQADLVFQQVKLSTLLKGF